MIPKSRPSFSPDYGTAPGTTLREVLDTLGLNQVDLAERTGRPKNPSMRSFKGRLPLHLKQLFNLSECWVLIRPSGTI